MMQIFGCSDLDQQLFHLAEPAALLEPLVIGTKFAKRRCICGKPGKAVHCMLFTVDQRALQLAAGRDGLG